MRHHSLWNEDLMKMETQCVLFYARFSEEEASQAAGWKGGMSITYQLGATYPTYLFRIILVSLYLQRQVRIHEFSGDTEGFLASIWAAQGKVRAVLSRLCDTLLNRNGWGNRDTPPALGVCSGMIAPHLRNALWHPSVRNSVVCLCFRLCLFRLVGNQTGR